MNWKQINEACPKAFLEWAKGEFFIGDNATHLVLDEEYTEHDEYHFYDNGGFMISVYVHHAIKLPFYFDQYGIEISASPIGREKKFGLNIFSNGWLEKDFYGNFYPDRLSATIAGATKAFEIREQQLNEAKQ